MAVTPARRAIGQMPGPGRDTPTGFPMAGLGWTGGEGTGWGGVGSRGLGLREGGKARMQGMGRRRDGGRRGWYAPGSPRPHAPGTSAPLPVPADLGGRKVGKGTGSEGPGLPLPPSNHLSSTPGPRVLPGDTVFSRMVISSMAEMVAATPLRTTARPLGRRL